MSRLAAGLSLLAFMVVLPAHTLAADKSYASDWEEDAAKYCLVPLGPGDNTQPALRLANLLRFGSSTDPGRAAMAALQPMMSQYMPPSDAALKAEEPAARWARLNFESGVDVMAGRYAPAQRRLEDCVQGAARSTDLQAEAACANNLGVLFGARGQYSEAQAMFERSSQRWRSSAQAIKPPSSAQAPGPSSRPQTMTPEMMRDFRAVHDRRSAVLGVERVELNLGNLALAVGQLEAAQAHFKTALASAEASAWPACREAATNDLARLYRRLGRSSEADALVKPYRSSRKAARSDEDTKVMDIGMVALGAPAQAAAQATVAKKPGHEITEAFSDPLAARDETAMQRLLEQAAQDERAAQHMRALGSYSRVALRAAAAQRPEIELSARAAMMRLYAASGQPAAASYHGKRAANLMQTLRSAQADAKLPRAARRTYLRDRQQVYVRMAQLLIDQSRLDEAEQVLRMLREDEGQQFQRATGGSAYLVLTEAPQEKAARLQFEQSVKDIQQIDESRNAVRAGSAYAILPKLTRAEIEQRRLDVGTGLLQSLRAVKAGQTSELEAELRDAPPEHQQAFAGLLGAQGKGLGVALRHLAEDAPQFQAVKATPQHLSDIAESLRRLGEIHVAFAPMVERMRRNPGLTMAQQMERTFTEESPAMKIARQPELIKNLSLTVMQQGAAGMAQLQQATGIAMAAYTAALTGAAPETKLDRIDAPLRGLPPEQLDSFLDFVQDQGEQMLAAGETAASIAASPQVQTINAAAAFANSDTKHPDIESLLNALKALSSGPAAAPAARLKPRPNASASANRVRKVQADLEQAVERARRVAGAPAAQQIRQAIAANPALKELKDPDGSMSPQLTVFFVAPLENLWRADQALERVELRQQQAESGLARQLATATAGPSSAADETRSWLTAQAAPTALLYYLPGDDRLDILLVSAKGRKAWRVDVPRAELDAQVGRLQAALRNRSADPRLEARAAYDQLFARVATSLEGVQVVALSLTGKLRFVPFAALYDGSRWLTERYALAVQPGARLSDARGPAAAQWKVAAFGASTGGAGLPPLPSVRTELESIVRQGSGGTGALPGRAWLNGEFTAGALRSALAGDSNVVHIASHFKFEPGDAAASFLLLGDGSRLNLQDLGGPGYRFDRTALVTLSACQTGLSEDDSFGQEVDGLAALLMAQGAPSVLASLWQVADDSTAELMGTLYRARQRSDVSRARALQQAQVAMIGGTARADAGAGVQPRGLSWPQAASAAGQAGVLGRAHPYHWAPFVLMGNWQ